MEGIFAVQAVMSLVDNITGPMRAVESQLAATERRATSLGQRMGMLAKSMLPVAAAAGALLLGFGGAVGAAADFEQALSRVSAVSQATAEEQAALRRAALDYGASTVWSALQVAQAEEYLAKAGFTVKDNLAALPAILGMASAGAIELGRAADIGSDILSAFGFEASQMSRVADVLTKTFTTANTDLGMLGDTMKYVAPVARLAGLEFEETAAMAGMLGNIGIKSGQAGTALRTMLSRLASPAGEASRLLRSLGVDVLDASGNMRSPVVVLGELSEALSGMGSGKQIQALETIFGVEAMTGASEVIRQQGLGSLMQYVEVLRASAGTAEQVAAEMLNNLRGDMEQVSGAMESLSIITGSVFTPLLRPLAQGLAIIISTLAELAQTPVGETVILVAGVLATAVVGIAAFAAASWAASAVLPILGGALAAVSWPIWAIVAAVGLLALAWQTNFGGMADKIKVWWNTVSLVGRGVWAALSSVKDGTGEIKGELAEKIDAAGLVGVVTTVARLAYRIRELGIGIWQGISGVATATWAVVGPILDALAGIVMTVAGWFGLLGSAMAETGAGWDVGAWNAIGQVLGSIVATIAVGYGVVMAFRAAQMAIVVATKLWAAAQWLLNAALNANPIGLFILGLVAAAALIYVYWEPISGFFGRVFGAVGKAISGAWDAVTTILGKMGGVFSAIFSGLGTAFSKIFDGLRAIIASFWSWLVDIFMSFHPLGIIISNWEPIKAWFSELWDWFAGFDLYESGRALIATFWAGIKGRASGLYDNFREFLGPLARFLPSSDAKEGPLSALTASGAAIPDTLGEGVRSAAPRLASVVAGALGGLAIAGAAPAPALADAPAAPEIRVETPAPAQSGRQQARQIIIQGMQVHLHGVKDADGFLVQLAHLVEAHDG